MKDWQTGNGTEQEDTRWLFECCSDDVPEEAEISLASVLVYYSERDRNLAKSGAETFVTFSAPNRSFQAALSTASGYFVASTRRAGFVNLAPACSNFSIQLYSHLSQGTYLMEDIRLFVSLVNWHLWFRLEHSEQAVVSVASHCEPV